MLKNIFYNTFIQAEKEREQYVLANKVFDFKATLVLIITAFSLSMIYYIGHYDVLRSFLLSIDAVSTLSKTDKIIFGTHPADLGYLCYWVLMLIVFYFIVPVLVIKLIFKENLSSYGLNWKDAFKDYTIYLIMLAVMIPLVIFFSKTASFQERYPFIDIKKGDALYPNFWVWESFYIAQFFALEFFFRGFMLHGLKPRFGFYSVFVMTIPYCMIHFGKPLPETLAAIIAGIVLGCLSLKSRSIFLGCLIHVSVGLGMDLASLWQKGFFD